jgi:glucosamine--fructose-6-phosphate aminotransferase (isomerizing)
VFKSIHFPNEIVTARRGSPLLIGVKTEKKLKVDFVDVEFPSVQDSEKALDTCKCSLVASLSHI